MKEIIGFVLLGVIVLFILRMLFFRITGQKYKPKFFGTSRIPGSSSQLPVGGNLFGAYYVIREGYRFSENRRRLVQRLISAFFLKWILEGKAVVQSGGGLLRQTSLELRLDMPFRDRTEMALFEMALAAAGGNNTLTQYEFNNWVVRYLRMVEAWSMRAEVRGRTYLATRGWLQGSDCGTQEGFEHLRGVIEFQNCLKKGNLSFGKDRQPEQWQDYLVMAALFGEAEKVARQLRLPGSTDMAIAASNNMGKAFTRAMDKEEAREERRSR